MNKAPKLRFKEFSGDWECKCLEDLFSFKNGLNKEKEFFGKGTPIVNFTDVYKNRGLRSEDIKGLVEVNEKELLNYNVTKGDVFFTRTSETIDDIGMSSVILDEVENTVFSGFVLRARPKNDILSDGFKKYCFSTFNARKEIVTKSSFTTRALTSGTLLNGVEINYPSKEEQEKIASLFSLIDDKISLQGQKVEYLKDYKRGMMQKIFGRELRFKDDEGRDYPEWEEKKFKDFTKINQGLQIPISERYTTEGDNRYFYITNEFLKSDSETKYYIENPSESVICYEDDILMTRTGNTGKVVTGVKGAFHNNFFKIAYDKEKYDRMFLYYILTSHKMQKNIIRLAGSSTIPDLNHSDFYNIKVKLPIIEEQKKIADLLIRLDSKISKEQEKLDSLNEYKKGLLQQMFV